MTVVLRDAMTFLSKDIDPIVGAISYENPLNANTTLTINSVSEVPNYDDELMLKKKRDELNRKLEMKKVAEEIESMKKELGE